MSKQVVEFIRPEGMHVNPAFNNVVTVTGPAKTIYVGGQNAVDEEGNVVGKGDIAAQTEKIMANLQKCLTAAGATLHDVIKFNIFVVQGQDIVPAYGVFQKAWGQHPNPPLVTAAFVAALAHPDFLAEIEAIAVVAA
jgi:enamine deaminase RidA (YjgF/YER057c/UK114 family)